MLRPPVETPAKEQMAAARPSNAGVPFASAPVALQRELLDRELRQLESGRIIYNPPTRLHLGVPERVQVRIARGTVPDAELRRGLVRSADARTGDLKIAPVMAVTLTGAGFQITPTTPQEQFLVANEPTEWAWEVRGAEPGKRLLHLSANVKVFGEQRQFKTFETDIEVWVTAIDRVSGFVTQNWQWLFAVIAGSGLVSGLYARVRRNTQAKSWEHP